MNASIGNNGTLATVTVTSESSGLFRFDLLSIVSDRRVATVRHFDLRVTGDRRSLADDSATARR
jgi:hypothetical protein